MANFRGVCGLWKRKTKTGKVMLTGLDIAAIQQLDPSRDSLLIFKNEKKQKDSEPDFQVVAAEKMHRPPPPNRQAPPPEDDSFGF